MKSIILNENNIGLSPGTAVYVGDRPASAMNISVITYDQSSREIHTITDIDTLPSVKSDTVMWIHINGLKDIDSIKKLEKIYSIHPLTIEDILNTKQQPKYEAFENYRFMSCKSIRREKYFHTERENNKKNTHRFFRKKNEEQSADREEFFIDQISIISMKNVVISFLDATSDPFNSVRKRILENTGRIRKMKANYLAYCLLDAVVDDYYLTLAHLEEDIGNFEDRAAKTSDESFITEIQDTKKYLFHIKRAILPLRDYLTSISRQNTESFYNEIKPFLQDLHENLNSAIETVDNHREWLSNIMEINLSVLTYQMNKVMRTLAIISAVILPLSFIAGIYGMNFENMPELTQPWAYFAVLGFMGCIASGMIIYFKTRRWL